MIAEITASRLRLIIVMITVGLINYIFNENTNLSLIFFLKK